MVSHVKRVFGLFILFILSGLSVQAQILEPVKWKFSINPINDTEVEVVAIATIDAGWHVYALNVSDKPLDIAPIPTTLILDKSTHYEAMGKPLQGKYISEFDNQFDAKLNYFENNATFRQKVKIKSDKVVAISGELQYMACDDKQCIFPDPELFELKYTPNTSTTSSDSKEALVQVDAISASSPEDEVPAINSEVSGILNPTKWSFTLSKIAESEYDLNVIATIDKGWHIYAQELENSDGPIPTRIEFITTSDYQLIGTAVGPKPLRKFDESFQMNVDYYEGSPEFRQRIKLLSSELPTITGVITYMICNDSGCMPGEDVYFVFNLKDGKAYQYDPLSGAASISMSRSDDPFIMEGVNLQNPVSDCGQAPEDHSSMWMIFLFGLIGGLLALVTPCVFPMIPLTVSFFTKGSEGGKGKRNAILYGFFILLIYFLLSLPFHLTKNIDPEILNTISTNVWLNIFFFVIFMVFAISFFGFYEIRLPSSVANKADSASDIGGIIGIFFMGLTLAIVSFSCTGPILGSVIGSIYGQGAQGLYSLAGVQLSLPATKVSVAMIGFGIGLGFPFGLFAAFPSLLKKLPKSGGWMDDFKVSLGFIEVALAIKFLSMADLVQQWNIITREVFFASWVIIGILWVLYLLGIFKFKKGQGSKGMSKFKLAVTVAVALFTLRLVPGVLPPSDLNKFKFMSGFPPPKSYTFYDYKPEFTMYKSLEEGMAIAKETGKPVFMDFTGWACVNCRSMEDNVWPDETVRTLLENEFVMVSLYVDEDIELPEDEQFVYTTRDGRKKRIKTVGNKWATLQTETFNNNSQPMYAIISPNGDLLAPVEKYNKDAKSYADWLKCGLEGYNTWKSNTAQK